MSVTLKRLWNIQINMPNHYQMYKNDTLSLLFAVQIFRIPEETSVSQGHANGK